MGHVDPHSIKIIPAAARAFFNGANRYAVVGRVISDPSRFDNKVLKWYQERKLPVTPVRNNPKLPNSELVEGLQAVSSPLELQELDKTSLSWILHPALGFPLLKELYGPDAKGKSPVGVWIQPGAESDEIEAFIKEHGLEDKIVVGGACILVHGDAARAGEAKL
ncbi:hypothetical protein VHUM_00628 [Vanrija humicola]|uniref:CoA-binding domain-containing protein n=1 Tax=Vanrija humicola TaxID=5417 RepID=A0A7D8V8G3_VANHU|nr:hypothetical protein VHUM_00628 [Vanrija humicola]